MATIGDPGLTEARDALTVAGPPTPSTFVECQTWGIRSASLVTSAVCAATIFGPLVLLMFLQGRQPGLAELDRNLWLGGGVLAGVGLGLLVAWLLRMARLGLRLEAAPGGLTFAVGHNALRIPWSSVDHATTEGRSFFGTELPVLAVYFRGAGYPLPRSFVTGGSEPTCLRILEDYLGERADHVAAVLNAARDQYGQPASEGTSEPASNEPLARPEPVSRDGSGQRLARGRSTGQRLMATLEDLYGEHDAERFAVVGVYLVLANATLMVAWLATSDLLTAWIVGYTLPAFVGAVVALSAHAGVHRG